MSNLPDNFIVYLSLRLKMPVSYILLRREHPDVTGSCLAYKWSNLIPLRMPLFFLESKPSFSCFYSKLNLRFIQICHDMVRHALFYYLICWYLLLRLSLKRLFAFL